MYFFPAHSTTLNFYLADVILHISMFPYLLVLEYKKYPLENSEPPGCSESAHPTSFSSPNSASLGFFFLSIEASWLRVWISVHKTLGILEKKISEAQSLSLHYSYMQIPKLTLHRLLLQGLSQPRDLLLQGPGGEIWICFCIQSSDKVCVYVSECWSLACGDKSVSHSRQYCQSLLGKQIEELPSLWPCICLHWHISKNTLVQSRSL